MASYTSSVPSMPSVREALTKVPRHADNEALNDTQTCTTASILHPGATPPASSEFDHVTLQPHVTARPPDCDRIRSRPSFRLARVSASPAMVHASVSSRVLADEVYDAIVNEVPHALVAHIHYGSTSAGSNLIAIDGPGDFHKGFMVGVPSFILVDGCQQSVSLAVHMLRSRKGRTDGAVILVLLGDSMGCGTLLKKLPVLIASGADDVIMIPDETTNVNLLIAVSLVKAQSNRAQKVNLKRQIEASKKQCHCLFFEIVHEIMPDFPQVQPQLHEIRDKCVADRVWVRKLGHGSFGSVYKWVDHGRQCSGAVKVFPKERIYSANQALRMALEIGLLQRLNHPNVIKFQEATHGTQSVYIFMEMGGTKNLLHLIGATEGAKGLSWPVARAMIFQIAKGLVHCHTMAVAHCDLKPENIVISDSDCVKIVDFGEALDLKEEVAPLTRLKGTMPFMAPEMMLCCTVWNPSAADIWSFAVIIVEILCGNHSFVHLIGWDGRDLYNEAMMAQLADEVKICFAKDSGNDHANALVAISGLCHDEPPPCIIEMMGNMFELMPERRIVGKRVLECIRKCLA